MPNIHEVEPATAEQRLHVAGHAARLSYVRTSDPPITQWLIRRTEQLSAGRRLQRLYDELQSSRLAGTQIWAAALDKLRLSIDYNVATLDQVPRNGPVVFVANHPFGIVDGLIMCYLISQVRDDFFLLVHAAVLPQPLIEEHLLPIDFQRTNAALKTNLHTKHLTTERLRQGQALGIFPSGMVATAPTPWGPAREMPWHTFVSRRIHEARCPVVPLYFHGRNSRLFQLASRINVNLRMGLLMHEVVNKIGNRLRVEIGEPIPYATLQGYPGARELVEYLRQTTLSLAESTNRTPLEAAA